MKKTMWIGRGGSCSLLDKSGGYEFEKGWHGNLHFVSEYVRPELTL